MSSLSDLPDDILGLISCLLNGFDNCSLWIASDSKLKQRLVNNVITDFHINYTTPARYIWPGNFLKKLQRLSRLSLVVDQHMYHLPIENIELFPIETLKTFKIDFNDCDGLFERKQFFSSNDSTGPTPSSVDSQYINIDYFFPNLEYFEFEQRGNFRQPNFMIDLLKSLPRNLKSLSIPLNILKLDPDQTDTKKHMDMYIALLPRTLTLLNLPISGANIPFLDLSKLPFNLTSLTTNTCIDESSFSLIPKNLTHLDLSFTEYNIDKLSPFLPPGLRSLKLRPDSHTVFGQSLAHLHQLEYFETYSSSEQSTFITKYPPNLKTCIAYFDGIEDINIVPFGYGIKTIYLIRENGYDRDFFVALPQTVTSLALFSTEFVPAFEFYQLLPKHLQMLETNLPIIENLSSLPESLTNLQLIPDQPCDMTHDQLPPKLETLVLSNSGNLTKSVLKALPESLTLFRLVSHSIIDDEVVASLPRGLKSMNLHAQFKMTDASAGQYPPNIEHLYLIGDNELTDEAIGHLPRKLKYLHLLNNNNFTDKCIKGLPRTLVDLNLPKVTDITWRCCKDLPPYLACLRLPACKNWKIDALQDLPKHLKWFTVEPIDISAAYQSMIRK